MPSVSAPKSQPKIPTPPASTHDEDGHPFKKVCEVMEKKVRNLEKRKGKLDGYRQEAAQGKTLNEDQKAAVARYDEVLNHLELAREMVKTFATMQAEGEKAEKKRKKKEREDRQARDLQVIKDVLLIQDVLNGMGTPTTRQALLEGKTKVTVLPVDLDNLDAFFGHVSIDRQSAPTNDVFQEKLSNASGHLFKLLEAKPKEIPNLNKTTYRQMKDLIFNISTSGVFDTVQAQPEEVVEAQDQLVEPESVPETVVHEAPVTQTEEPVVPVNVEPIPAQLPTAPILQGQPIHAQPQTYVPSQELGTDFNFLQESLLDQRPPVSSTMAPPPGHAMLPPSTHPRLDPAVVLVHSAATSTSNALPAHPHLPYPAFLPVSSHPPSPPPHIPMPPSHQLNIPFVTPVITQQYVNQTYAEPTPPAQMTHNPVANQENHIDVESAEQPKQAAGSGEQQGSLNWGEEEPEVEGVDDKQDDKNWSTFSARNDNNYEGGAQRRPYRGRGGGFRGGRGRGAGYGGGYRNDNGNYRENGNFRERDNGGGYRGDANNRYENRDREQGQGYRGGRGGFSSRGGPGAPRGRGNVSGPGGRGGRGGQGYDSNRQ